MKATSAPDDNAQASSRNKQALPLSGLRVLDMSRVLAGPSAGQMLGDFGAEVIKVERPGEGDQVRSFGNVVLKDRDGNPTRESAMHLSVNRNKQSITIDLSTAQGQDLVKKLAVKSDILLENYIPGNLTQFGLDYDHLREVNPAIIYCSVSGFGQDGPYANRPGYDVLFQAMGGWMELTGHADGEPGGGPMKVGPNVVDMIVGLNATVGILLALRHRDQTGQGQHIDVALLDTAIATIAPTAMQYLIGGFVPKRTGNNPLSGGPSTVLQCKDGPVFYIAGSNGMFEKLCQVLNIPDVAKRPEYSTNNGRWERSKELTDLIQKAGGSWMRADFIAAMDKAGLPAGAVNDLPAVFADPQVQHRGVVQAMAHPLADEVRVIANPIRMSETPARYDTPAPMLGQHNDSILGDLLGLDAAAIDELRKNKII